MATLTLPEICDYTADPLIRSASYWETQGDHWGYHTSGAHTDLTSVIWTGDNNAVTTAHSAQTAAMGRAAAPVAQAAARYAPVIAQQLMSLKSTAMTWVAWAGEGGYRVHDDLTVEDMVKAPDWRVHKLRDEIGQWLQEGINQSAQQLLIHDVAAAAILDGHGAMLADAVRALDNPVCDDPGYSSGIERRFWATVGGTAIAGGLLGIPEGGIGVVPGFIGGALTGAILDIMNEIAGEGPKCR